MNITEIKGSRKGLHWEQGDNIKNYVSIIYQLQFHLPENQFNIREPFIYILAEFVR